MRRKCRLGSLSDDVVKVKYGRISRHVSYFDTRRDVMVVGPWLLSVMIKPISAPEFIQRLAGKHLNIRGRTIFVILKLRREIYFRLSRLPSESILFSHNRIVLTILTFLPGRITEISNLGAVLSCAFYSWHKIAYLSGVIMKFVKLC